jgi:type I restriction enzyme S subunit
MTVTRAADYADSGVDWLGVLPAHWVVKPIKAVATLNDEVLSEATPPDSEIEYVEISDVAAGRGILGSTSLLFEAAPSRARRRVADGDIIVSTVRTYLRAIASVENPPDNMVVSTGFAVIRPRTIDPTFLAYALEMDGFINQVIARSVGVSYPAINASELVRLPVPVPPSHEQTTIAAFLDRETGKIDALVEAQQRLINLLKEKRQAVVSRAVTKGLDPAAPMKDSGVEWIGEVPSHWQVKALKRVTESCCDGPFGSGLKSEHYVDDGVRVVRLQNIKEQGFDGSDAAYIDIDYFETSLLRHDVRHGDVLIAGLGDERNLVGRACVAPAGVEPAMVKADCFRFRLGPEAEAEFVALQLNAGAEYTSGKMSTGSTRSRIALSSMMDRLIVVPSLPEQQEIVARLGSKVEAATALVKQAEAGIVLLLERRAALISAAVTGKIDVRQQINESVAADQPTARRVVGAAILELVADTPTSGRMTSAKRMYLAETHAGIWELRGKPQRMAAGPFDGALMSEVEAELARVGHIATSQPGGPNSKVHYRLTGHRGALRAELDALLGDRRAVFDKMLSDLAELKSKGVEAVATLYAVWNDMLIDGQPADDKAVIDGVLNDWHVEKRDKFTRPELHNYLGWMRRHDLTPSGRGPRTKSGALL